MRNTCWFCMKPMPCGWFIAGLIMPGRCCGWFIGWFTLFPVSIVHKWAVKMPRFHHKVRKQLKQPLWVRIRVFLWHCVAVEFIGKMIQALKMPVPASEVSYNTPGSQTQCRRTKSTQELQVSLTGSDDLICGLVYTNSIDSPDRRFCMELSLCVAWKYRDNLNDPF